ncbi:hypothetical protein, partial [Flavihumibacter cheonanensis]|uniref:hypothetical protein n=1 Tax=Flavihumibacter cheonanensis TaxID=1442385 RepID=UPI001EF7FF70
IRLWNLYRSGFFASPLRLGQVATESSYPILTISPDSRWLFYVNSLWDLAPLAREQDTEQLRLGDIEAVVAVFSPDSRWLAIASKPGRYLLDTRS